MATRPEVLLSCLRSDLALQGFDPDRVDAYNGPSIAEAAACSIRNSFLKKLRTGMTGTTMTVALDKFLAVNDRCGEWTLPSFIDEKTSIILGTLRKYLDDFWHEEGFALVDHPHDMLDRASVGPGANRLARSGSFYSKLFASPLSCSRIGLSTWYLNYIKRFPRWQAAEDFRRSHFGEPKIVPSNRLSFVPKNDKESRTICTEPTLNTMFQIGFGRILEQRLLRLFGISLQDQQFKNRALARLGSLTDGLSTIDLSSASDSISVKMLREFLPSSFLRMLEFSRCATTEIDGVGTVKLNMVSTMGNGFTFPLQTVLFSAVVASCLSAAGIPWRRLPHHEYRSGIKMVRRKGTSSDELWGVFGDDIICPRSVTEDVISTLGILGFSTNRDKTFVEGPFRESCGHDFFLGTMIRGVYIKSLDTQQDCAAVLNQLTRFCARTPIDLRQTIRQIRDWYPEMPMVPRYVDMSAGFHVPLEVAKRCKHALQDKKNSWYRYRLFVPKGRAYRFLPDGTCRAPAGSKSLIYNPDGLFVSQLQGSVRASQIGVRDDLVRWRLKRRVSSVWDDTLESQHSWSNDLDVDWERWNTVVEAAE